MPIFTGGLDTRLPLEARQPQYDLAGAIMQGMQIGNAIKSQIVDRKKQQSMAELLNNPNIRDENGLIDMQKATPELQKYGGLSAALYPALNQMAQEQNKSFFENQKTRAETGLVGANTTKANADVQKTTFDMGIDKTKLTNDAFQGLRTLGDKVTKTDVANRFLPLVKAGALGADEYAGIVDNLPNDPAQLYNAIQSFTPIDNQTQEQGQNLVFGANQMRVAQDASQQADTAAYRQQALDQSSQLFYEGQDRQDARQQATITAQQATKGRETMQQGVDRQLNAQQAATMAQSAARASQAAASLILHKGLDSGTGLTALSGKIPSTDAKAFQTDLENLKSQLFMPMIQQMRGMGALSNAEGAKVEAAVQNLDPSISPSEMRNRLKNVAEQMNQLAQVSAKEAKVYATGGGRLAVQPPQTTQNPFQTQPSTWAEVGKVVSMADAKATALASGKTTQQVINDLRSKGIQVK